MSATNYAPRERHSPRRTWNRDNVIAAIRDWWDMTGSAPRLNDWIAPRHGRRSAAQLRWAAEFPRWPSPATVTGYFGSWNEALEAAGVPVTHALPSVDELTARVAEAKRLDGLGLNGKEIAKLLDVHPHTARSYLRAGVCSCGGPVLGSKSTPPVCARCAPTKAPHWDPSAGDWVLPRHGRRRPGLLRPGSTGSLCARRGASGLTTFRGGRALARPSPRSGRGRTCSEQPGRRRPVSMDAGRMKPRLPLFERAPRNSVMYRRAAIWPGPSVSPAPQRSQNCLARCDRPCSRQPERSAIARGRGRAMRILESLRRLAAELGRRPKCRDVLGRADMPSNGAITRVFGHFSAAVAVVLGEPTPAPRVLRRWTREDIVAALRDLAQEMGRRPRQRDVAGREDMPSAHACATHFGSFTAAVDAAYT